MREILFRGKCKTDNEWLYGFPYVTRKNAVKINWYCSEFGSMRTDEVDPETVGQYTGLTDKNSKRIYEGDIAEYEGKYYVVRYSEKYARFIFTRIGSEYAVFTVFDYERCEVIGNIHDNPELLKGGGNNG